MGLIDHLTGSPVLDLSGDGVLLRTPRRGDFTAWRALRDESRAFLKPWEPLWSSDELSHQAFRARLRRYDRDAREKTSYTFFVFDPTGTTLYGGTTIGQIRRGVAQSCMLGYWMGQAHAGKGLMQRAVEILKLFAFDMQGLHRIEAACLPSNQRSIRLLEKCRFQREGRLRRYLKIDGAWEDHYLYALLAEEWTPSRSMGQVMSGESASAPVSVERATTGNEAATRKLPLAAYREMP